MRAKRYIALFPGSPFTCNNSTAGQRSYVELSTAEGEPGEAKGPKELPTMHNNSRTMS